MRKGGKEHRKNESLGGISNVSFFTKALFLRGKKQILIEIHMRHESERFRGNVLEVHRGESIFLCGECGGVS